MENPGRAYFAQIAIVSQIKDAPNVAMVTALIEEPVLPCARVWTLAIGRTPMIRVAHPEDAAAIAAIHIRGWQAAYANILPADFLAQLSIEQRTARWREILARQRKGEILVYCESDAVVGWIDWGLSRDGDREGDAEILAVYVEPSRWHHGIGKQLMRRAEDGAFRHCLGRITLWVLEQNLPARRFCEGIGYADDGARKPIAFGGASFVEARYEKLG
jgi:GNAT superfamily N-acetyltransferase